MICLVALVVLCIIGIFIALVMVTMAIQRAAKQYAKLQQVRVLAEEYIVRDLADPTDLGEVDNSVPSGVPQLEMTEGGGAPLMGTTRSGARMMGATLSAQALMVPDPEFQQKMQCMISKDIRAIYEGPDPRQALATSFQPPDPADFLLVRGH